VAITVLRAVMKYFFFSCCIWGSVRITVFGTYQGASTIMCEALHRILHISNAKCSSMIRGAQVSSKSVHLKMASCAETSTVEIIGRQTNAFEVWILIYGQSCTWTVRSVSANYVRSCWFELNQTVPNYTVPRRTALKAVIKF
jgi:hypothetical protein